MQIETKESKDEIKDEEEVLDKSSEGEDQEINEWENELINRAISSSKSYNH